MNTMPQYNNEKGAITLAVVFFSAAIMLLLALRGHAVALKDHTRTNQDTTTEQAFFAAQGCIEEGYLQLRTDEDYDSKYTSAAPLEMGNASCILNVSRTATPKNGTLQATGNAGQHERTVVSSYRDAGPSQTPIPSALMHVFDRSGSMDDNSCSITGKVDQEKCLEAEGIWGPRLEPFATAQDAAKSFTDHLDDAFDVIGLVTYNQSASLIAAPVEVSDDFANFKKQIENIAIPSGTTNISAGIETAASELIQSTWQGRTKAILLLTDGRPNQPGGNETQGAAAAQASADAVKNNGIIIFSIGLGNGVNHTLLENIASKDAANAPLYFRTQTAADLEAIYQQIADILITYNIGQDSWEEQ